VEYSSFAVGPESDKYRLSVSGFSGDTGDAIDDTWIADARSNGMQFTCADQDNDNCPAVYCFYGDVGWWHNCCSRSAINHDDVACWNSIDYVQDVIFTRMLVKLD